MPFRPLFLFFALAPVATAAKPQPDHWVGTWAAASVAVPNDEGMGATGTTLRETVHVSLGGKLVRVTLSNEFGTDPLTIGEAHIALSAAKPGVPSPDIALSTANALTFGGSAATTIPPGGVAVTDPVSLALSPFADLDVSLFLPAQTLHTLTGHGFANQTSFTAPGNAVSARTFPSTTPLAKWRFLKAVEVLVPASAASIVTFGDSITDGVGSTRDANSRWPDLLALRLQADKRTAQLGVLNEGISGNRVLHDDAGPSALARFDRDVLAQEGVKYVVLMESINDIGQGTKIEGAHDIVTAQDLIAGLGQLATRAHAKGLKVIGATLTPFVGAGYQSPAGETMRQAVNDWIRTTHDLDGVIDFDKATRDPANPTVLLPANDSGDHLHPSDTGYKTMADFIDLALFISPK